MLTALQITGFRAFRSFSVDGLTRVNLLVGGNNAGKTCVLEAAEIVRVGEPWILLRSPTRRGDGFVPSYEGPRTVRSAGVSHLFHGHELAPGASFTIEGRDGQPLHVRCEVVVEMDRDDVQEERGQAELPLREGAESEASLDEGAESEAQLALRFECEHGPTRILRLDGDGILIGGARYSSQPGRLEDETVNFVGTTDPDYRLGALWDRLVLTPNEARVIESLQIIEPGIERVALLSRPNRALGGILVKQASSDRGIPIGTMGDGLKRLLVLSANLVSSAGGCLLVDEIDTGLHHSVMPKMWRLVIETARRLDVQVLATTHSLDCLRAMAHAYVLSPDFRDEISVHRIDRGKVTATRYGADELRTAIDHDMDMR